MATSKRHPNIVNLDEVEPKSLEHGTRFAGHRRALGRAAGGAGLGASHMRVPPGKAAWPAHYHAGNDEAVFILEGKGKVRLGDEHHSVRAGDYIALPAGPLAHQILNDSDADLVYLCLSTQNPTDVTVYPDSGKIGVFGGAGPGGNPKLRFVDGFHRQDAAVAYYDGEDD